MSQKKQKEIDLESLTPEEKVKYEIAFWKMDGRVSLQKKPVESVALWHGKKEKKSKIKNDKITAFHVRFPGCGDFFLGQEMFDKIVFSW